MIEIYKSETYSDSGRLDHRIGLLHVDGGALRWAAHPAFTRVHHRLDVVVVGRLDHRRLNDGLRGMRDQVHNVGRTVLEHRQSRRLGRENVRRKLGTVVVLLL